MTGNKPVIRIENITTSIGDKYGIVWGQRTDAGLGLIGGICTIHTISEEAFNSDMVFTGWKSNANTEYLRYDASANALVTTKAFTGATNLPSYADDGTYITVSASGQALFRIEKSTGQMQILGGYDTDTTI